MALSAGGLFEIRSGGNDNNGCYFYDEIPGTSVDYTQQDAPQVARPNLTTPGAGSTTLTDGDAGGLFTTALPGNGVYIVGGANFTVGLYYIKTRTDANNVVLDRSPTPGGAGANGVGNIGGGRATITDAFLEGTQAGDTVWVEDGNYTPGAAIDVAQAGTATLVIRLRGYKTTRGVEPLDADRPSIDMAAFNFQISGDYWRVEGLDFTGTDTIVVTLTGADTYALNCKVRNTSGVANRIALSVAGSYSRAYDCDLISDNGYAVNLAVNTRVEWCFIIDSAQGIRVTNSECMIRENIIHNHTTGIAFSGAWTNCDIVGNTIDGNTEGINIAGGEVTRIQNNILSNNTDGAIATGSDKESNELDFNDWYNNGTDVTLLTKGPNAQAADPLYTNLGADNFSLAVTSTLRDLGFGIRKGVG